MKEAIEEVSVAYERCFHDLESRLGGDVVEPGMMTMLAFVSFSFLFLFLFLFSSINHYNHK
jgi:hypothetical protein